MDFLFLRSLYLRTAINIPPPIITRTGRTTPASSIAITINESESPGGVSKPINVVLKSINSCVKTYQQKCRHDFLPPAN